MKDIIATALECYQAYVRKDRAAVEQLIDDSFHFTSPLDNRIDRKTYFERCWPNSEHIAKFTFIETIADKNKVLVVYEATSTKGDSFRNTEILEIKDEKIVNVEVYFGWSIPHKASPGGFVS